MAIVGLLKEKAKITRILNDEKPSNCSQELHSATPPQEADIVAPSDMMDGANQKPSEKKLWTDMVFFRCCDNELRGKNFCSAFYGPFSGRSRERSPIWRSAAHTRWIPRIALEALREVALDVEEGADLLIVKPGTSVFGYSLANKKERFELPTAVYNVSGEYAMLKGLLRN